MDEAGNVQAVGDLTEKIEGFRKACRITGLNGTQRFVISKSNIDSLMLDDELSNDIKTCRFQLYAVDHIDEALRIFAGKSTEEIFSRVNEKVNCLN